MTPYKLPLRIKEEDPGFRILDANGVSIAYVWAEKDITRASILDHPTREQGKEIAKRIARSLTDAAS